MSQSPRASLRLTLLGVRINPAGRHLLAHFRNWCRLILCVAFFAFSGSCIAESLTGTTAQRTSLDFRIVIPAIVHVTAVLHPDRFEIDNRDIERGYIDFDESSSVILTTNSRQGFFLTAQYETLLLAGIEVRAGGLTLATGSGTGSIRMISEIANDRIMPIGYRLHIAQGVRPGTYPWPVALVFSLGAV